MNPVKKSCINALAEAIQSADNTEKEVGSTETVADFVNILLNEPDKKKRRQMMKDFSARRADVAKFLAENEELINAEAEMALIGAAVGTTVTEEEVSYKNGKRFRSKKKKHIPPNVNALNFLLKNRMPDKYSDKPVGDVEIEDVSDIERMIDGEEDTT